MNKCIFLFLGLLIFNEHGVICSQVKEATYQETDKRVSNQKSSNWVSRISKALLVVGILSSATVASSYFANHSNLDQQRPFTCADIYHRFSDGSSDSGKICAHLQEPFGLTRYEYVPRDLRRQCSYPHMPSAPIWALPGEIESLRLSERATREKPFTSFMLLCRYEPRRHAID